MDYQLPVGLLERVREELEKIPFNLPAINKLYLNVGEERVKAYVSLLEARGRFLYPKDKEYTDLDRKTLLGANTAAQERDYQFLVVLEQTLANAVSIGLEVRHS